MKKITFLVLLFSLFLLVGCYNSEPDFKGIIVEKKDNKILVIEGIEEIEVNNYQQLLKEGNHNIWWVTTKFAEMEKIKVGMKVSVWIDGEIATSYPSKVVAEKIKLEQ